MPPMPSCIAPSREPLPHAHESTHSMRCWQLHPDWLHSEALPSAFAFAFDCSFGPLAQARQAGGRVTACGPRTCSWRQQPHPRRQVRHHKSTRPPSTSSSAAATPPTLAATTQHPASAARAPRTCPLAVVITRTAPSRQATARSAPLTPHTAPGKRRARPTHLPVRSGNHPHRAVPAGRRQVCAVGGDCDVVQPAPAHRDDDSGDGGLAVGAQGQGQLAVALVQHVGLRP